MASPRFPLPSRAAELAGGSPKGRGGHPHLAVDAQHQQHREEEDGPEGRDGQLSHRLWVRKERQPGACGGQGEKEERC